jgi:hypothetical protein
MSRAPPAEAQAKLKAGAMQDRYRLPKLGGK